MAVLQFGTVRFDSDLVLLDKDGTLVDFDHMWGQFASEWVAEIVTQLNGRQLHDETLATLGYDAARQKTRPGSPLVSASPEQLQSIVATLLLQHGISWSESIELARDTFDRVAHRSPPHERIRSFGNVPCLLADFQSVGVKVAVVTTDDRRPTMHILEQLGISRHVDTMVCGDDGIVWKPEPTMFLAACTRLEIPPEKAVVVGDTMADMMMAASGGAGLKVAVLSGVGNEQLLRQIADVTLASIADVVVVDRALRGRDDADDWS